MKEPNIYCIAVDDRLVNKIKDINCVPVGLGDAIFSKDWKRDLSATMISIYSYFQKSKHIMTIVQNNEKANQVSS